MKGDEKRRWENYTAFDPWLYHLETSLSSLSCFSSSNHLHFPVIVALSRCWKKKTYVDLSLSRWAYCGDSGLLVNIEYCWDMRLWFLWFMLFVHLISTMRRKLNFFLEASHNNVSFAWHCKVIKGSLDGNSLACKV